MATNKFPQDSLREQIFLLDSLPDRLPLEHFSEGVIEIFGGLRRNVVQCDIEQQQRNLMELEHGFWGSGRDAHSHTRAGFSHSIELRAGASLCGAYLTFYEMIWHIFRCDQKQWREAEWERKKSFCRSRFSLPITGMEQKSQKLEGRGIERNFLSP